jgi:hypothetical protein
MAYQQLEQPPPPSDELLKRVPVPALPNVSKRWLSTMKAWVLTLLIFHIIAAELLIRAGYPGASSVIIQTRATRAFFIRCWLSLYGWIDKEQLVYFIDWHMKAFQEKDVLKFEFWNGLKSEVYRAQYSKISCLKQFQDSIFAMLIDTYRVEFLSMGEQYGLSTQDINLIWKKEQKEQKKQKWQKKQKEQKKQK